MAVHGRSSTRRHVHVDERVLASRVAHRSFVRVLANALAAEPAGTDPVGCLRLFVEAAISQRSELVLALNGGPPITSRATCAVRTEVHRAIRRVPVRGTG